MQVYTNNNKTIKAIRHPELLGGGSSQIWQLLKSCQIFAQIHRYSSVF